jgi:predicted Fe-Mo cluster-binding NifX family protein
MDKKFAITSKGKTLRSMHDINFGMCNYVLFYTPGDEECNLIENPFSENGNADYELATFLAENNVTTVVTGGAGIKSADYLASKDIQLVIVDEESIKIEYILDRIG